MNTVLRPQQRLLGALARRVAPEHLHMIAHGDYGRDVAQHFEALMQVHDTLDVPGCFDWHPREVMELFGWSDIVDRGRSDGFPPEAQLCVRAFCCTALLMQGEPDQDYDEKLFALSESLAALPGALREDLLLLLDWMEPRELPGANPAYINVVRLLTQLELGLGEEMAATLGAVLELESEMLTRSKDRLDCIRFGGVRSFIGTPHWQRVGERLAQAADKAGDPTRAGLIELVGRSLIAIPPQS